MEVKLAASKLVQKKNSKYLNLKTDDFLQQDIIKRCEWS